MIETFKDRPTETLSGAALAGTVYGLLTQVGVPVIVATIASVVVAFGPAFVSHVVDLVEEVKHKDVKGIETTAGKLVAETVTAEKLAANEVKAAQIPPSQSPTDPNLRGKF